MPAAGQNLSTKFLSGPGKMSSEGSVSMADSETAHAQSSPQPPTLMTRLKDKLGLGNAARRTLGLCLLLLTVCLWTFSNFLASVIFSDETYDKPFFLVYMNTSVFAISLIPMFIKYLWKAGFRGVSRDLVHLWQGQRHGQGSRKGPAGQEEQEGLMAGDNMSGLDVSDGALDAEPDGRLGFRETAKLSFEFCMLWFTANYFSSACLEYTSVASTTILTSTSSIWTLILGAMFRVETFSVRKLVGVVATLAGVVLISTVDLSGSDESDEGRGSFPYKTPAEMALGDTMALISAFVYGIYVTVMKKRVGNEDNVDMRLFFGLVGVFNLVLLWPIFFFLHWTGIEPFEMPPTGSIWAIIVMNSLASFISDISWALAMLLTTPLVVQLGCL